MSQTCDDPQTVTVHCSPLDFEAARAALESNGYYLTDCDTNVGHLELTATRKACACDLCCAPDE